MRTLDIDKLSGDWEMINRYDMREAAIVANLMTRRVK